LRPGIKCPVQAGSSTSNFEPFFNFLNVDEFNFFLAGEDMEVHEFDMRFPPAQSDASEGEEDAPIRDRSALWDGGVIPYELGNSISK
jgi:hypothetical protein